MKSTPRTYYTRQILTAFFPDEDAGIFSGALPKYVLPKSSARNSAIAHSYCTPVLAPSKNFLYLLTSLLHILVIHLIQKICEILFILL
jgi:hypothetical protein